jgi:HK97 family phage portal protein
MILDAIFQRRSLENPSSPADPDFDSDWNGMPYNSRGGAGVRVSSHTAIGFHPVFRAVDLISSTVGKLPLHRLRVVKDGKEHDTTHPLYNKLLYRPSPEMDALTWKKTMEAHRMMEGNGYTFCRRRGDGQIIEYVLLDPKKTCPIRASGVLYYLTYRDDGSPQLLNAEDVIHIKGLGFNGLIGFPLWYVGQDSIGAGIATIAYTERYFKNNAIPAIVIEVPIGTMMDDPKKREQLAQGWNKIHGGVNNAHKTGVLTGGAQAKVLSNPANEAQLTEAKKFSIIEVSNLTGLPPHKLGDSSRTAYNSLEQENQSFLDDCLDWRLVDWEQELWHKVLTEKEKDEGSVVILFDRKQLLRADIKAKADYLSKAIGGPWMTVDEGRTSEDMNRRPGGEGDMLYGPQSMPKSGDPKPADPVIEPDPTPDPTISPDEGSTRAHRQLLQRSCVRMAERIARNSVRVSKSSGQFLAWLDEMSEHSRAVMVEEFGAPLDVCRSIGISETPEALAQKLLDLASRDLSDLTTQAGTQAAFEGAVQEWSKRFTGPAMEQLVNNTFKLGA